jgi:hypothetical protein
VVKYISVNYAFQFSGPVAGLTARPKIYNLKIDGHLRKCTVPACSHAISGMRMSEQDMDKHMLHHEYAGHLESRTPYPIPVAADDLDPEEVEELLTAMDKALEKETTEDNESQGTGNLVDSDLNGNIDIRVLRLDRTSEFLARSNEGIEDMITYDNGLEYIRQSYENQQFFLPKEWVVAENMKLRSESIPK